MSNDERDRLIGALMRERGELMRDKACLQQKLHQYGEKMSQASRVVANPMSFDTATHGSTGERVVILERSNLELLPTASDIGEIVRELQRISSSVEELNRRLQAMGLNGQG